MSQLNPLDLIPTGDRVLVEIETVDRTKGGLFLPDASKDRPQQGLVLAVGDGGVTAEGKPRRMQVEVGDTVLFPEFAGDGFKLNGENRVLLLHESDILAVVED
jgi:chaperonin GroES